MSQRRIRAGDTHVGLRQAHLGVVDEAAQEGPLAGEPRDRVQAGFTVRRAIALQRDAQAIPARQVDPRLCPGERPRDGAQRVDGRRLIGSPARCRSRTQAQVGQFGDRRDVAEEPREPGIVMDQGPIGRPGGHGQFIHDRRTDRDRGSERRLVLRGGGQQDGGRDLFEMAAGDGAVRVVRRDDLTLFGELQAAVHRPRRLPQDGPVGRSAAPPDGPAPAMEEGQLDARGTRRLDQR